MARRRAFAILFLTLIAAYPALMRTSKQVQRTRKSEPTVAPKPAPAVNTERAVAQRWLTNMTLRDKIAQLVIITSYGEALVALTSVPRLRTSRSRLKSWRHDCSESRRRRKRP